MDQRFGIITYMNNYLHESEKKKKLSLPLFFNKLKIKRLVSEDELTFVTKQIATDLDIIFYVLLYDRNI